MIFMMEILVSSRETTKKFFFEEKNIFGVRYYEPEQEVYVFLFLQCFPQKGNDIHCCHVKNAVYIDNEFAGRFVLQVIGIGSQ